MDEEHRERWKRTVEGIRNNRSTHVRFDEVRRPDRINVQEIASALRGNHSVMDLDLSQCDVGDAEALALAAGLRDSAVERLHLGGNHIGHEGALALADALTRSCVRYLDLSENLIGDTGVSALAACLRDSSLKELDLDKVAFSHVGAVALLEGLRDSDVTSLGPSNLDHTGDGFEGIFLLLRGPPTDDELRLMETLQEIRAILSTNRARCLILQMEAKTAGSSLELTLRTLAGNVVAVLPWFPEERVQALPRAIWATMQSTGFKPPWRSFNASDLKIVLPNGAVLDRRAKALPLWQQAGFPASSEVPGSS